MREDLLEVLNVLLTRGVYRGAVEGQSRAALDQTYCVPNRVIFDILLVRDVLDIAKILDLSMDLISLDQVEAFDRVEHQYLWSVLAVFFAKKKKTLYFFWEHLHWRTFLNAGIVSVKSIVELAGLWGCKEDGRSPSDQIDSYCCPPS